MLNKQKKKIERDRLKEKDIDLLIQNIIKMNNKQTKRVYKMSQNDLMIFKIYEIGELLARRY